MPHQVLPQRILSCHFPHITTDRIARQRWGKSWRLKGRPEALPIVVVDTIKNALRVVAIEDDPRLSAISIGQTLSDARAINPQLDCVHHDLAANNELLEQIARWCERYTPLVAISGNDGLFLDVTGCAHLFGGEQALLDDLSSRLQAQGFGACFSIADTAGAAWALSRFSNHKIAKSGLHRELLEALPINALRLPDEQVRGLSKLGLKTVGCLTGLPRAPIAARFGGSVLQRLDQALGWQDEVLSPIRPVAELVSEKRFPDPIAHEDDIKAAIMLLTGTLASGLEKRGVGMRQSELILFRADGEIVCLSVEASSPLRDPRRIAALFDERLASLHDEWEAGFGFDVIRIQVLRSDKLPDVQQNMISADTSGQEASHLSDRLSARLGKKRVQVYQAADSHVPERRFALVPAVQQKPQRMQIPETETVTRPIVLFDRPELAEVMAEVPEGPPVRFRWRKAQYEVTRSEGPERIACEWWKDGRAAHTRDYFRVETSEGHRLWLYRHGLYERETAAPKWYVHGLFA